MTLRPAGGATESPAAEQKPRPEEMAEAAVVAIALAQGLVLGAWLGVFPAHALRVGGFPQAPAFFVRWAGVLQVALSAGYALEWGRLRRATLLVVAKGLTCILLGLVWAGEGLPAIMMIAVPLEGSLALAGALLHGPAERSRRARVRLRLVTQASGQIRPAGRS